MFDLNKLIRNNIRNLKPYSSARDEYKGAAEVYLDANESYHDTSGKRFNRYPDPLQRDLKTEIGTIKNISPDQIFLGNGSDECIDLLYRCFCVPGRDNVIICPPTYGMYEVSANINDIEVKCVPLTTTFDLNAEAIHNCIDDNTKLIWICSPNNPTGNLLNKSTITLLLKSFEGLVVVDEAYMDFAQGISFLKDLQSYPNLVVLQTFSKAWGLAALRLGMCFASHKIIEILNKVKPPYNINQSTQQIVHQALKQVNDVNSTIKKTIELRNSLARMLINLPGIEKAYPSNANFLLVKVQNAKEMYRKLLSVGIVVRDRSNQLNCDNCLRITIGTEEENELLINTILQTSID